MTTKNLPIEGLEGVVERMKEDPKACNVIRMRFEAKFPNSPHVENWVEEFDREEWTSMNHPRRGEVLKDRLANRMTWDTHLMAPELPEPGFNYNPPSFTPPVEPADPYPLPSKYRGGNMKLGIKQELFMRLVPRLIDKAHELGFEIRGGDLFRDPRLHGDFGVKRGYGNRHSCHKLKLAIDLNLMKDGHLVTSTSAHKPLGTWWEKQHELCTWGGNFNDGNHYSITHKGSS